MCKSGKTPEKQWKSSVESFVEIIHIFMEHPKSYPQSKKKNFSQKTGPDLSTVCPQPFHRLLWIDLLFQDLNGIFKIFVLIHIRSDLFRTVDNGSMVTSS